MQHKACKNIYHKHTDTVMIANILDICDTQHNNTSIVSSKYASEQWVHCIQGQEPYILRHAYDLKKHMYCYKNFIENKSRVQIANDSSRAKATREADMEWTA